MPMPAPTPLQTDPRASSPRAEQAGKSRHSHLSALLNFYSEMKTFRLLASMVTKRRSATSSIFGFSS